MKSLLYIKLYREKSYFFGVPRELQKKYGDTFDLDNFSDQLVVNAAINFLDQSSVYVIILAEETAMINKLMPLFHAIRASESVHLELQGNHKMFAYLTSK